jgi:hypothetical protein
VELSVIGVGNRVKRKSQKYTMNNERIPIGRRFWMYSYVQIGKEFYRKGISEWEQDQLPNGFVE